MRTKILKAIQKFRFIDDIFFSVAFDGFIPGVELILRTVTGNCRIVAEEVLTQKDVKNWYGKSVRFDVFASAGDERFCFEIQRDDRGAIPLRARYDSALMDSRELQKGTDYKNLPKNGVIFICEHDVLGGGLPIYHVQRTIQELNTPFNDKSEIIYVNGECQDDTPLGRLMHDFFCDDAKEMYYSVLSERMRFFKEDKGGTQSMCEIMEELNRESEARGEARINEKRALAVMSKKKFTLDEIAEMFELPLAKVEELGRLHHLI